MPLCFFGVRSLFRSKFFPVAGCLLALVLATGGTVAADEAFPERPPPTEQPRFAHPITVQGTVEGRSAGMAFIAGLDPALQQRLRRDKMVLLDETDSTKGSYAGLIRAVVLFNQPKQQVYDLIRKFERQVEYLPRLTESTIVWQNEYGTLMQFAVKVLWVQLQFQTQHWLYPELSRVEWALNPDHDNGIAQQIGFWQLYSAGDNYTVAEYGTRVDTGVAVPQRIQEFLARRDIPDALDHFKKHIDSGGVWQRGD